MNTHLSPGHHFPLGATVRPDGVNFCVFSKNCYLVELLLFDTHDQPGPSRVIRLDPSRNRTFYYWHVFVPGLKPGQLYGYRVHGPYAPELGHRFDGTKVLIDPYARAVMYDERYTRDPACRPGDNAATAMRSVVVDPSAYDWEDDTPLNRPLSGSVLYEMHVGGFTKHPSSGVADRLRGTYAGMAERVLYLQDLGVTAVELLPVLQFDDRGLLPPRKDYWGYNPVALFAPHRGYSSRADPLGPVTEFRDLVKALHRAGIEVILDMVFNHTAEGDHRGPTLSFRGFENRAYYILDPDMAGYANYSGCGNTLNGNHSIVRRMILDCLRYWVQEMHVDGFRFDLASILARDEWGQPLRSPPILWDIESDPVLAGTKIIAEAWDAAGLYQVGSFIGHRWAEWNGPFRDDARRFVRGDDDTVVKLAHRLLGSPDVYPQADRDPHRSINFVTCHDGFTLNDLVSYNHKHNEANGEHNRDGNDTNWSWNCGHEGPTEDGRVLALRDRQMKNLLVLLFVSQGTPMLLMGDEVCRTQLGNNNTYCHDNELNWFDWTRLRARADMFRFVQGLIRFRQAHEPFRLGRIWSRVVGEAGPLLVWHGVRLYQPDWKYDSHTLAFSLPCEGHPDLLYVILNAYWEPLTFELPQPPPGAGWYRVADTALPPPYDMTEYGDGPPLPAPVYRTAARSAVILLGRETAPRRETGGPVVTDPSGVQ